MGGMKELEDREWRVRVVTGKGRVREGGCDICHMSHMYEILEGGWV